MQLSLALCFLGAYVTASPTEGTGEIGTLDGDREFCIAALMLTVLRGERDCSAFCTIKSWVTGNEEGSCEEECESIMNEERKEICKPETKEMETQTDPVTLRTLNDF